MRLGGLRSPCQLSFVTAFTLYPVPLYLFVRRNPSPVRLAKAREALSVFHCTLMTVLSLICLQRSSILTLLEKPSVMAHTKVTGIPVADKDLPIITTKSTFANVLTTFETAYLLQDSLVFFYADYLNRTVRLKGIAPAKGLNITHLAWHHAGFSAAFITLQYYIHHGREKGILIIIMMMLMNASSPFGAARWYLVNFRPSWKTMIGLSTVTYLSVYAVCRVYLIYYILRVFGAQQGKTALQAYNSLRWQCKTGTGMLALVNTSWLVMGVTRFARRCLAGVGMGEKRR